MHRREFAVVSTMSLAAAATLTAQEGQPQLDAADVRSFVGKSHGNIDFVREMLKKQPAIVNATMDWGNGDWETGLGAASHMGRRDIAGLLLDHGARIDLFAAAMLGHLKILKAIAEPFPEFHATPGPHGIDLLSHTIFGGDEALETFDFVLKAGANPNSKTNRGATPLMVAAMRNHAVAVKALIEKGADPAIKDNRGEVALDYARNKESKDAVAILERL